jgi:hypothetical protein
MILSKTDTLLHKDSFTFMKLFMNEFYWKLREEIMKKNEERYLTNAAEEEKITIQTDGTSPNLKNIPGDSIDGYTNLKTANSITGEKEIGQQNENL